VTDALPYGGATTRGLALAPGETRAIDLTTALNGERIPMTITRPATSTNGTVVHVTSTLAGVTNDWCFYVGE
jgi:hypothetical protein